MRTTIRMLALAIAVVGASFLCFCSGASAETLTLTTNSPESVRSFLIKIGFDEWRNTPRRAREFQAAKCRKRLGKNAQYLGTFIPPLPNAADDLTVICLSPIPSLPAAHLGWCALASVALKTQMAVLLVKDKGFTIVCGPPGKES